MFKVPRKSLLGLALLTVLAAACAQPQVPTETTIVYLVRHAEKVDSSADPALTEAGRTRAALLADMLRDANLTHVHSTDLERTRDTAAPIASDAQLDVRFYDPNDLEGFAQWLRSHPGRHLVSGHSDTTPKLVRLLGGVTTDIQDHEYDRLYILTLMGDGQTSTVLMRFGESS